MRIGLLTGGGDAPGLNAVIRAVVRKAVEDDNEVVGFRYGWRGVVKRDTVKLDLHSVRGILFRGGTILGSSRTNPLTDHTPDEVVEMISETGTDALIAIGGDDTLGVAAKLVPAGGHVVGVPKTIDNDLSGTEFTFGFNSAVEIATEAVDRLQSTAESHDRVMVVEVMGRHAGWIAMYAGIAGGADVILIPEQDFDIEEVCEVVRQRKERGVNYSIVVVAEGAKPKDGSLEVIAHGTDEFGHVRLGGIAYTVSEEIERRTGFESRVTILGHTQRGGMPTAFDRVLATRFAIRAYEAVIDEDWGTMVALRCGKIVRASLEAGTGKSKTVPAEFFELAKTFFG